MPDFDDFEIPEAPPIACYLLMRTDLASLNAGKGMAQAHHAGTHLLYRSLKDKWSDADKHMLTVWLEQGNGFGTVFTLGAEETEIKDALAIAKSHKMIFGTVRDPSYPLRDGGVTHSLSLETCAYILGPVHEIRGALINLGLGLHP